jgi:hypothetical protein
MYSARSIGKGHRSLQCGFVEASQSITEGSADGNKIPSSQNSGRFFHDESFCNALCSEGGAGRWVVHHSQRVCRKIFRPAR